jgi:hypothetical protein
MAAKENLAKRYKRIYDQLQELVLKTENKITRMAVHTRALWLARFWRKRREFAGPE